MQAVFLDTAPLIYLIEGSRLMRHKVREQLMLWIDTGASLRSSVLTLTELLVPAKRSGNAVLVHQYKSALNELLSGPLQVIDENQAEWAAEIRAEYRFSTPDALQLAAARAMGCDVFFSNDRALRKFKEIEILMVAQ